MLTALALIGQGLTAQPSWQAHKVVSLEYPALAAQARIEGVIEVDCAISDDGSVRTAQPRGGNEILAKAARENVLKWRFYRTGTDAVAGNQTALVVYTFKLTVTCSKNHCPTTFTFEFPNLALVETEVPGWQP